MSGETPIFRRQQGTDGDTTERSTHVNAGYWPKLMKYTFFACMGKLPHQTISVEKYTGLPALNLTLTQKNKREVCVGFLALPYSSDGTTAHSKATN